MLKYHFLVLLLFTFSFSWAQIHPKNHQHVLEVLHYEQQLKSSFPVYLGIPEGLEEAAPLHFYETSENGTNRLSTYYFTKEDSLVTSAIHQWGQFDALFKTNLPYNKKNIKVLRDNYQAVKTELEGVFGKENKIFGDTNPKLKIRNQVVKWQVPILYDPTLDHREMEQGGLIFGVSSLSYTNLSWEEAFMNQLGFFQYYFLSNIKADKYSLANTLLGSELQTAIQEEHFKELSLLLNSLELELYNTREGYIGIEREYLFMYRLVDADGTAKYTLNLAFNNKQDISFLQYKPIK